MEWFKNSIDSFSLGDLIELPKLDDITIDQEFKNLEIVSRDDGLITVNVQDTKEWIKFVRNLIATTENNILLIDCAYQFGDINIKNTPLYGMSGVIIQTVDDLEELLRYIGDSSLLNEIVDYIIINNLSILRGSTGFKIVKQKLNSFCVETNLKIVVSVSENFF